MDLHIDDVRLHCETVGDGEPLLFVHGFPLSGRMWTAVASRLTDRWRCFIPDLRGHGRSTASESVSIARFADDLAALLDKTCEWRPVVLIGLSMGGIIGFEFFRRYRGRLRALVLCDTRANAETAEGVARREALARAVLERGSPAAAEAMIDQLFGSAASEALKEEWRNIISANPPLGVAAAARALANRPDSTLTLSRIDCPTLVIVGDQDALTPPDTMAEMHRAIPSSRFEWIEGAGHLPPVEQPDAVARVLREFLERL